MRTTTPTVGLVLLMLVVGMFADVFAQRPSTGTPTSLAQLQAENARLTGEVARLTAEINRLTAELARRSQDVTTSSAGVDAKRQEAIASLRAVQSVLAGGGAAADFKKYQLESKIKVDALPDSPVNATIKEVSTIFTDASTLVTAGLTQSLSATEVRYFKTRYGTDPTIGAALIKAFGDVPDEGFSRAPGLKGQLAVLGVQEASEYLMLLARKQLDSIK